MASSDDWRTRVDPAKYPTPCTAWPPIGCGDTYEHCPLAHPDGPDPERRCFWYAECVAILHGAPVPTGVTLEPGESVTFEIPVRRP
jgi:hypothetical protein